MNGLFIFQLLGLLAFFLTSCSRAPLREREEALRLVSTPSKIDDDLSVDALIDGLEQEVAFLASPAQQNRASVFQFGKKTYTKQEYLQGLQLLIEKAKASKDKPTELWDFIHDNFDFYEVYGGDSWGDVFITGYYEAQIKGRHKAQPPYTQALYRVPDDMIEVPLDRFGEAPRTLIGRLSNKISVRGIPQVLPYYSRKEIDSDRNLAKKNLEIAFVDPVDAFFLQIQGSGIIDFEDGKKIRVGYAGQNGHRYEALGRFFKDQIPLEQMTQARLEAYLRTLPPEKMQDALNRNPSYVFFKPLEGPALTYLGTPVVDGRTIATDTRYFPKGALAFLSFEKPTFASPTDLESNGVQTSARFVLDHDRGGAINGGGRLDLFTGSGAEAKRLAGVMKNHGHLYYLAPKAQLLERKPASVVVVPASAVKKHPHHPRRRVRRR